MPTTSRIVYNLRVPGNLDDIVEAIARVEFRTKCAVISMALTEYARQHYPELFNPQSTANSQQAAKGVAK
jgi:hypothetical protein